MLMLRLRLILLNFKLYFSLYNILSSEILMYVKLQEIQKILPSRQGFQVK